MSWNGTAASGGTWHAVLASAPAVQAQEKVKVRFGILTTASQAAFYVGVKKGIFEKHGFIWGGRWYHYDTMHFEYRPEMIAIAKAADASACR